MDDYSNTFKLHSETASLQNLINFSANKMGCSTSEVTSRLIHKSKHTRISLLLHFSRNWDQKLNLNIVKKESNVLYQSTENTPSGYANLFPMVSFTEKFNSKSMSWESVNSSRKKVARIMYSLAFSVRKSQRVSNTRIEWGKELMSKVKNNSKESSLLRFSCIRHFKTLWSIFSL